MSKKLEINFAGMARSVMFAGKLTLPEYGVQYRKGRGINDVNLAVQKARKYGRCKVECELGLLEVYLRGIFKAA